jgi:hypothetical protein
MDEEILTIAEKIDTLLEHATHMNDLQNWVMNTAQASAVWKKE